MALPATQRGLKDLASLRSRIARDYGVGRMSWMDFEFINERLADIEARLMDIAANDPKRMALEEQADDAAS